MIPQIPTFFRSMSLVLMVLTIEAWVSLRRVSGHLVRPFKEWFIFYLLENSMHRFSKYSVNHLGIGRSCWSDIIFSRLSGIESVRPEIPPFLKDNLRFAFSLLLILLNSFVFINPIYKLTHTGNRFTNQWFPQSMLIREADLESADSHIFKIVIYFIVHLPISIQVYLQGFTLSHG